MKKNFNLINPDDIAPYLAKFTNDNPDVSRLLVIALETALKKRGENIKRIETLPAGAPEWLQKKWDAVEEWHAFHPIQDIRLPYRVAVISKWIKNAIDNDEKWLAKTDAKGRPLKLMKIGTLEQAMDLAEKYDDYLKSKYTASHNNDIAGEDIQFVAQVTQDIHVVKLLTAKALDRESRYLGHCAGDDRYDEALENRKCLFYSFRNKDNCPQMTLQVDFLTKRFIQCRTKNNLRAKDDLLDCLNIFVKTANIHSATMFCDSYLYENKQFSNDLYDLARFARITGDLVYHPPCKPVKLAKKLVFEGSLNFYGYDYKRLKLPQDLTIQKNLSIISCPFLKKLPEKMAVSNDFTLAYCYQIEVVPALKAVAGSYHITDCFGLQRIEGESLNIGKDFYVDFCPKLVQMPETLVCEGFVSIVRCTSLTALPKKLHAKGGLRIAGCDALRTLPEDFFVKGYIYTEFGVFDNVDAYRKAFEKHLKGLAV